MATVARGGTDHKLTRSVVHLTADFGRPGQGERRSVAPGLSLAGLSAKWRLPLSLRPADSNPVIPDAVL